MPRPAETITINLEITANRNALANIMAALQARYQIVKAGREKLMACLAEMGADPDGVDHVKADLDHVLAVLDQMGQDIADRLPVVDDLPADVE